MDKLNALYMKNKERFESILELDTLMKKMGLDPERYADLMAKVSSVEQVKMEYQSNLFTAEKEREIMINAGKDIAVLEMQKQDLSSSVAQLKNEKRNVENATSAHKMRLDSLKAEEPKIRQSIQSARNELERIKSLAQATQEDVTNIIMQTTDSLLLDKKVLFTLGVVAIRDAVREDPGFILQLNPVARGDVPRDDQLSSAYRRFQAAFDRNYELLVQEITRRTYQQMLNSQATDTNG